MNTKEQVLEMLRSGAGEYISGEEMAAALAVSRSAVCLAVAALRREGHTISACTNRGYSLSRTSDVLSARSVEHCLKTPGMEIRVFDTVESTNALCKALADAGMPEGLVIAADRQTKGRGRSGRSFYSPGGTGLYMSVLLRPALELSKAQYITTCAAVAVAEALEELSGRSADIKWVNDIYMDGKKVCGILTESSMGVENCRLSYAVLGIGVNVLPPTESFPDALEGIAAAAFSAPTMPEMRSVLAADILDRFMGYYADLADKPFLDSYRRRSMLIGRTVDVLRLDCPPQQAQVLGVDDEFSLLVRYPNGREQAIFAGEVSLRI